MVLKNFMNHIFITAILLLSIGDQQNTFRKLKFVQFVLDNRYFITSYIFKNSKNLNLNKCIIIKEKIG